MNWKCTNEIKSDIKNFIALSNLNYNKANKNNGASIVQKSMETFVEDVVRDVRKYLDGNKNSDKLCIDRLKINYSKSVYFPIIIRDAGDLFSSFFEKLFFRHLEAIVKLDDVKQNVSKITDILNSTVEEVESKVLGESYYVDHTNKKNTYQNLSLDVEIYPDNPRLLS